MFAICLRFANNAMEAEDILQEGFIKIFKNLHTFRNEGSIEGWIRRTILNTAINSYKKNLKYQREQSIEYYNLPTLGEETTINRLNVKELTEIIQSLPTKYRIVFNLNAIEGYTHKEIGELLGISDNTSKSQLTRARFLLKERIRQRYRRFSSIGKNPEKVSVEKEELSVAL